MNASARFTAASVAIEIRRRDDVTRPVHDVSFSVAAGEAVGLVGESGSGKSLTLFGAMGLLPSGGTVAAGRYLIDGEEYDPSERRGRDLAMIFQDPGAALNPTRRVGDFLVDVIGRRTTAPRQRALDLMAQVGIPDPDRRFGAHPHELSGGLRQRIMIAAALAVEASVVLCDEPTTALDVTVQDQVLGLLDTLRRERDVALVFVTHDLAVVGTLCQRVVVMYAGHVVEVGTTEEVFRRPRHPYTAALLAANPAAHELRQRLAPVAGTPPEPRLTWSECPFADRCPHVRETCRTELPQLVDGVACHLAHDLRLAGVE